MDLANFSGQDKKEVETRTDKLAKNGASLPEEADMSSNLSPSSTPKPTLGKGAPQIASGGGGMSAGAGQ